MEGCIIKIWTFFYSYKWDITRIAQLAVFIRNRASKSNIYEELIELLLMHDTTTN